ncbi:MAG: phosphoribosylanthranilate isomerase, partial [Gemmatimonadaceae bacterium]
CCMSSDVEVARALAVGATALGFVSAMPSGPGPISEDLIARLVPLVPPSVDTFLLTSLTEPQSIAAQHARCGTSTIQLVDHLEPDALRALRRLVPSVRLVQVVHVTGPSSIDEAEEAAPLVDAILLDSGNPSAARKELGGTGRTHDWKVSALLREAVAPVPVLLAGGLRADNVAEAIRQVQPFGVDVCSGVRSAGILDAEKLGAFVRAARGRTNSVRASPTPAQ